MFIKVFLINTTMGSLDLVQASLGQMWQFVKQNYKGLSVDFIKIYLLSLVVLIAEIVVLATFVVGILVFLPLPMQLNRYPLPLSINEWYKSPSLLSAISVLSQNIPLLILISFILIFVVMIFGAITLAINAVQSVAVEERLKGKKVAILDSFRNLLVPVGKYSILTSIATILAFAIPSILILASFLPFLNSRGFSALDTSSLFTFLGTILAGVFLFLIVYLAWILVMFFIQFAILEIVFNKLGPVESIHRSIAIVKKNLLATFIFDMCIAAIAFGIGLVFAAILFPFRLFLGTSLMVSLVEFIIGIPEYLLITLITVPAFYFFWKSISQKQSEPQVAQPAKILNEPTVSIPKPKAKK